MICKSLILGGYLVKAKPNSNIKSELLKFLCLWSRDLKLSGHVRMDKGYLEGGVDGDVLYELPVCEVTWDLPQAIENVLSGGIFGLVWKYKYE